MSEEIEKENRPVEDAFLLEDNNSTANDNLHTGYSLPKFLDERGSHQLSGMFYTWFLDYASYVNLSRAIPHITDGLKPVQRRVLHSMKRLEDGRYNKVANIVGHTMQYHPHGDSSIYETLVGLGQKNILIDTQGNWGNILTGDVAAAGRYIEARLSRFAIETVFNHKTTMWKPTYDGRNDEPIALPVKFPLLLAQGSEGIGVGLNSKILPHNFNELIDASIAYLHGKEFELLPDFQTCGMIDVSKYNDGQKGGKIRIRSKISKSPDNKSLIISDIPYGVTTPQLIESVIKANEKGKINIKKIDDNTAENVEVVVHLDIKTSSDKTIDALYAFTLCEVSYSPNCCVIDDKKPTFVGVSDVLKRSTDNTLSLLQKELEIERKELEEQLMFVSLEKIFIEERIYKDKEFENAKSIDIAIKHIDKRIEPYKKDFLREVTKDDLMRLLEIKMVKIMKFNTDKAKENILLLKNKIDEVDYKLNNIVEHTINWFRHLKDTYGKDFLRQTEIRSFDNIEVTKVVEANQKLFVSREDGFIGTNLKKEENIEFVQNCSDIDDIIIFFKSGKYKVIKVSEKQFVGKGIEYVAVYKRNDQRTIFNAIYRDGKNGSYFIKRFFVSGVTRDKEYDFSSGKDDSRLIYFSANPNGEAEVVRVTLKPTSRRIKKMQWDVDFSNIAIKGRASKGNLLTKFPVAKITFKQEGISTLGGTKIWFDHDVLKLNNDQRGTYLGEFSGSDQILVICNDGNFFTTNFDITNHYNDDIMRIEKFSQDKIWSVALFDAEQGFDYIKRFKFEPSIKKISFVGDNKNSFVKLISDDSYPLFNVRFGGKDENRESLEIDVESFIAEKSYKAKGKRISNYEIAEIERLEPIRKEIETEEIATDEEQTDNPDNNNRAETQQSADQPAKTTLIYDKDNETDLTQGSLF